VQRDLQLQLGTLIQGAVRYQQELTSLCDELHHANIALNQLAYVDGLTGLAIGLPAMAEKSLHLFFLIRHSMKA
jgi:hypothetical protein